MLRGSLTRLPLADVLRLLAGAQVTGRLTVRRTTVAGTITFLKGGVVGATLGSAPGTDADDSLDAAIALLDGSGGDFAMRLGPVPAGRRQSVDHFLTAVDRRRARSDAMVAELGGPDAPVRFSARLPAKRTEVTLAASQWRLAVLVDGRRSLSELARAAGLSTFRAASALVGMLRSGLLMKRATAERPERAVPARKVRARSAARSVAAERVITRTRARTTRPGRGETKKRIRKRVTSLKRPNGDKPSPDASGTASKVRRVLDLGR